MLQALMDYRSIFFLFIFSVTVVMKAFFRSLAAAFTRQSSALSLAGVMILALALYTGYTIPQPSMIGALRWLTYLNVRFKNFSFYFYTHDDRSSRYAMASKLS